MSNLYELKPCTRIPNFNIVLPKDDIRNFLISNSHIKRITQPEEFIRGLIVDLKVTNEGLLVLLNTKEAFESIKTSFKTESIDWYISWFLKEWVFTHSFNFYKNFINTYFLV